MAEGMRFRGPSSRGRRDPTSNELQNRRMRNPPRYMEIGGFAAEVNSIQRPEYIPTGRPSIPIRQNLQGWYRYRTGVFADSVGVKQWTDSSGMGNALLQSTDANKPLYNSDGSVTMDTAAKILSCATLTVGNPSTIYCLARQLSWVSGRVWIGTASNGVVQTPTTPNVRLVGDLSSITTTAIKLGTYYAAAFVMNGASSVVQVNNVPSTDSIGLNPQILFAIGSTTVAANVQYKEIAVYNVAHGVTDRFTTLNYLAKVGNFAAV